jgi:hypothetical protein
MATPLTVSEVRSMLLAGLRADTLSTAEQRPLKEHHLDAYVVVRLLHGACSCDLVKERNPDQRADEADHRVRYRKMGCPRDQVIPALELHRRALEERPRPPEHWTKGFADFVAEHARNAGPTLYYRQFSPEPVSPAPLPDGPPITITAAEVRANPGGWLPEGTLVLVEV